jgi:hypothetical protein
MSLSGDNTIILRSIRALGLWCMICRLHRQIIIHGLEIPRVQHSTTLFPNSNVVQSNFVTPHEYIRKDQRKNPLTSSLPLFPLSRSPLLLMSSQPVATEEECKILMELFDTIMEEDLDLSQLKQTISQDGAWTILERIQNQIDEWVESPRHDGESPLPRYVTYEPVDSSYNGSKSRDSIRHPNDKWNKPTPRSNDLLPDGLHVDTNNSQHFRHITVLLYLTTTAGGGATTFPLANASPSSASVQAAISLIQAGITHTQMADANPKSCQCLEDAARELYNGATTKGSSSLSTTTGIRVLPKAGHVCVFFNLDGESGMPDPMSFHGGEADLGMDPTRKALLVFFKEIPFRDFGTREEFAQLVRISRQRLEDRYFQPWD